MYKIGDKLKLSDNVKQFGNFTANIDYEIASQRLQDRKFAIFDNKNNAEYFDEKELSYYFILIEENKNLDNSFNNGGSTSYYKFNEDWKECQDIIEHRDMNFSQGNIFKSAFCFNIGRHTATTYKRELNKIIYFAKRELERIEKDNLF